MKRKSIKTRNQSLGIEGLEWQPNLIASHTESSIYHIKSDGGVSDLLFHKTDETSDWFDLHVGQIDRLTFFGALDKTIFASFIDCRKDSPTQHRRLDISFNPDPMFNLHIDRGIAYKISNKKHITIRVENIWYMSEKTPDYDFTNDNIVFRGDEAPKTFPTVRVNELPMPDTDRPSKLLRRERDPDGRVMNDLLFYDNIS